MSIQTSKVTTVDVLRHGQCQGGQIFRGSTDVLLTDLGWQQMEQALENYQGWEAVVASPLRRCQLFAEQYEGMYIIFLIGSGYRFAG